MRVDVVGVPTVTGPTGSLSGSRLGGRRAHVVVVALALEGGALSGARLADLVWEGRPPTTWPVALRGVVGGLRAVLRGVGIADHALVETVPGGYRLSADTTVDVTEADALLVRAQDLVRNGRPQAARDLLVPLGGWRGDDLLAGSGADWLAVHRERVDATARRAWDLMVESASASGEHGLAVATAEQWVTAAPLDERAHRSLIAALDAAGDRAGAVRAYEACRALLADELGVDPTRETVDVYLRSLGDQRSLSQAPVPRAVTTFHGRADELREVADRLSRPGLATVVGPAGVGKSRVAAEVALALHAKGTREVRWVPLEVGTEDELVAATVAVALGLSPGDDPVGSIVGELAPYGPLVLVLDGCEAALDGAATLAGELVGRCPQLTVLATSRLRLGLQDEELVGLSPWPVPEDETEDAPRGPALELLTARAGEGAESVGRADPAVLGTLLRHCSGIPLAIELVAAQLSQMAPADLADRLDQLVHGDDPVRRVAGSSYALLSEEEASVFRGFAALDGSVGLSVATQVLAGGPVSAPRVVRILGQLVALGLLRVDRGGERWRWSQDDELHRYARELLADAGEEAVTFSRLASAVLGLLPDDPRAAPGPYAAHVTDLLASVRSLLAAAVDGQADAGQGLELVFRLHRYWAATSVGEGRFWLGRLLDADGTRHETRWRPYATYALGYLEYWAGDSDQAVPRLREAAELLTGVDDQYVARALVFLAGLLDDTDHPAEAVATIRRSIAIAESFGPELRMPTLMGLGSLLSERGDPEAAEHAHRAIEVCRASGDADQLRMALPTAAMICWMVGADDDARAYVAEAMPLHDAGPRIAKVVLYSAAAGLALADGDVSGAAELAATADADGTELGVERELPLVRSISARALLAKGDLAGAADRASAALEAALTISYDFPLAIGLETAALVIEAAGADEPHQLSALLDTAAELRRRGDRPPPATMPGPAMPGPAMPGPAPLEDVLAAAYEPLDARTAARLARKLLADL
jgi:predicted ATPase/DNA-binding SARP family transcriptional activator